MPCSNTMAKYSQYRKMFWAWTVVKTPTGHYCGENLAEGKTGLSFAFQRDIKNQYTCAWYNNLTGTEKEGKEIIGMR